jgi:hypothetical protein
MTTARKEGLGIEGEGDGSSYTLHPRLPWDGTRQKRLHIPSPLLRTKQITTEAIGGDRVHIAGQLAQAADIREGLRLRHHQARQAERQRFSGREERR